MFNTLKLTTIAILTLYSLRGFTFENRANFGEYKNFYDVQTIKFYGGLGSGFVDTDSRKASDTRGYNFGLNLSVNLQATLVDHDISVGLQNFNNTASNGGDFDTNALVLEYAPTFAVNNLFRFGPVISSYIGEDLGFSETQDQNSALFWGAKISKEFGVRGSDLDFRVSAKGLRDFNVDNQRAFIGLIELQVSFPTNKKVSYAETLNDQLFGTSRVSINESKSSEIQKFARKLKDPSNNWSKIVIYGHADERGTPELNKMLSLQRAKSFRTELLKNGVDIRKITIKALGENEPLAVGSSELEYSLNRRVSVEVL